MQISASALFFALVTGLLGAWLFLWQTDKQHQDFRVTESRVACDKARFDSDFAGSFGHASQQQKDRERAACGDEAAVVADRSKSEEEAHKQGQELKKSIENALTNDQAQAQAQQQATQAAASAVAATTKAAVAEIKK
ncbi:hypothetical protein MIZ01_1594 [Sideroxyarcus emersonii]|uniref:Uncharacterized protein n=1 Tax=Sideroxyarcus emersonii TaxID=2764705 RepID=A0AAN1XB09_9PROT|nr:hypothetical protein [Sideroxyarcus emersonii]BCK87798.1 hypothetical protein MIZ01_1594 [Sideroxyarcus emersonii]